ncbi:MAG: acylneuraminate cytidylyltransferase, partial [Candidatus Sericytochromatia bacterium]|nr:acylneuraminate cytidylyltransferase [Candidatus Sericytochromatia bacterium]
MKNLAIIQARTGSSRLPDKVLMKLENKTVLEHVFNRVKKSKLISDIVVATTLKDED